MLGKKTYRRITVPEMAPHVHSFVLGENKVDKISNWLISWIEASLKSGKVVPYDFLPHKSELACHIGVSLGTIQNVFRYVEDLGYVESKQRVGTYIKDPAKSSAVKKLTSKKEQAIEIIKKYIIEKPFCKGDVLPSTRELASYTNISAATLRIALGNLVLVGILEKKNGAFYVLTSDIKVNMVEAKTLAIKTAENVEEYIRKNLKAGDKLPTNNELAKKFSARVKTIHDAIKVLTQKGILYTRRGRYGTLVLKESLSLKDELYHYEKVAQKIKHLIAEKFQVGDKLPSILEFSENYGFSAKTIKKALDGLQEDGYITFVRGRYGGTFVTDIPQSSKEAYTWLALNSDYITGMSNS